jgi:phosphatidylserine/phosphatidylglycerophosphate/cardiolipin synthase-like enzyme
VNDPAALARAWAEQLPGHLLDALTHALRTGRDAVDQLRQGSRGSTSAAALDVAHRVAASGEGAYLAGLLAGFRAARADQPTITPVWTGPDSDAAAGSRLTLAVVAGLIDEARNEILLVSYATAPSVEVRDALVRAAGRGVKITALLERSVDNPAFTGHPDPLHGIAHTALTWPAAAREPGASMHAKILIIDRVSALVGSANLTGYGVERNLECGVLIRGGTIPAALAEHVTNTHGLARAVAEPHWPGR